MTRHFRLHYLKCPMLLCALFAALTVSAVPAKPGLKRVLTLANGTKVEAMLVGDEYGHYWLAEDGKAYIETTSTGLYTPANLSTLQTQAGRKRKAANEQRTKRMAARREELTKNILHKYYEIQPKRPIYNSEVFILISHS